MNDHANPDYCWIHHVVEKQGQIRCGECMHWFADAATLLADFNVCLAEADLHVVMTDVSLVRFCPHCSHDF